MTNFGKLKNMFLAVIVTVLFCRPAICEAILHQHPEIRILAVASTQNHGIFYRASLDIHADDIESSEMGFLSAVRRLSARVSGVS